MDPTCDSYEGEHVTSFGLAYLGLAAESPLKRGQLLPRADTGRTLILGGSPDIIEDGKDAGGASYLLHGHTSIINGRSGFTFLSLTMLSVRKSGASKGEVMERTYFYAPTTLITGVWAACHAGVVGSLKPNQTIQAPASMSSERTAQLLHDVGRSYAGEIASYCLRTTTRNFIVELNTRRRSLISARTGASNQDMTASVLGIPHSQVIEEMAMRVAQGSEHLMALKWLEATLAAYGGDCSNLVVLEDLLGDLPGEFGMELAQGAWGSYLVVMSAINR